VAAALLGAACANPGPAAVDKDDMLVNAGFVPKRVNTATRMAMLKGLPPHQIVARTTNSKTRYLYADPIVCGCIYVGDQGAYDRYRQNMVAQRAATDEQIRAILSSTPLPGEEGL
jgi:hypothetical protein